MSKEFRELVIEAKGRGLIPRGGSKRLSKRIGKQLANDRNGPKAGKRFSALGVLENRQRGRSIGMGYDPQRGYASLPRRGKYA